MPAPTSACIGLRQPHAARLRQQRPPLGFLEVHSENYFAPGGAARAVLAELRQDYAISLHGVGLSLGSACGLDEWHLDRLVELVSATTFGGLAWLLVLRAQRFAEYGDTTVYLQFSIAPVAWLMAGLLFITAMVHLLFVFFPPRRAGDDQGGAV